MAKNLPHVYEKANSILDLRGSGDVRNQVVARIHAFREKLSADEQKLTRRQKIAAMACDDVLGRNEAPKFWLRPHVIEEIARLNSRELERYLFYRYRYDVYPAEKIVDEYPPCVQIEPASICNYRCVFCYQVDPALSSKSSGHMGMMDISLFKAVVDQLEGNVEAVTLASRGEPLVNPQLTEMLKYMSGKFLAAKVNTNASLLSEKICHTILESGIQTLVFSADAAAEPMYSRLRVNGKLERVLKNIEQFNEIRTSQYPESRLITRVSGVKYSTGQDINEMEKFWSRLVDQVAFVDYNAWEKIYQSPQNNMAAPCSDLWRRVFVWWDGRVNPCDVDYVSLMSLGSVADRPISGLWQCDAYQSLRRDHLDGKRQSHEPCARCRVV